MGARAQIIVVLISLVRCISVWAQNADRLCLVGGRRGVGAGLGESGISTYRRGGAAGGGRRGGATREDIGDSETRMNGETMSLTVDRNLTVMLPIYYPFFNPFDLIPIRVADVDFPSSGRTFFLIFECAIAAVDTVALKLMLNSKLPKYDENKVWQTSGYFRTDDYSMSDKLVEGWNSGCKEKLATS
ncbi:hypothetical protein C8J57DRAFT_1224165 [Mycena rebaudengoi]|nr:hypothetical protein C8J57DRAFT_1224165 [Mycena rebaudengoi]